MNKKARYLKSSRPLVISLTIINLIIILISLWYFEVEKKTFIDQKLHELSNISEIKINAVNEWRKERLSDARYLAVSPRIKDAFHLLAGDPVNKHYRRLLYDNLNGMFLNGKYESMVALDSTGRPFFSIGNDQGVARHFQTDRWTKDSLAIYMGDFLKSPDGINHMQIIIPQTQISRTDTVAIGWLALNINLDETFYPMVESLPVPSESMHVLIENRGQGYESLTRALSVSHPIPGSKSQITVSINKEESYRDVRKLGFNILLFTGLLILALSSSISFFWMRQRSEFLALESEKRMLMERFDMLSKFANDAIIVYTQDLTILQVNDKALELYGYERSDILGMNAELLRTPELRSGIQADMERAIQEGGYRFETTHIRKDGTTFPAEVSLRYMELLGSPCFQSIVRDITQRMQFEKALIASEERLRLITNTVPLVVWTARSDGSFDFVNSRFESITGYYPLKENSDSSFIHPDDQERVINYWKQAIHDIREHQIRFRARLKDGSYRWFLCLAMPMCNNEGQVIRWYGSATDIDELESMVEQRTTEIREHEKEILKLNAILQEHSYSLEYANKELEAFIFSVSHDLRAPLRAINGFSKILLDDYKNKLDEEGQQILKKVWKNADRMRQLIDDLLRLSRAGRHELSYSWIDMPALFNSMTEETRQAFPDRTIVVKRNDMPGVHGDVALLKQVILNLLSNAVKFSGKKDISEIEIGSILEDHEITYYVKDNGTGFDMKFSHELFAVFRRLNNADEYEGTGVGLALVKRIIDKHGGRVWAYSEPGKGATFYFSVPLKKNT